MLWEDKKRPMTEGKFCSTETNFPETSLSVCITNVKVLAKSIIYLLLIHAIYLD